MLTFIKASIVSARFGQRCISIGSGKSLGFFKDEKKSETSEIAPVIEIDDEVDQDSQMRKIDAIRNKSRLLPQHRNILHGTVPYKRAESWVHKTLKYQRKVNKGYKNILFPILWYSLFKIYGKFGSESGVDPRICFWSPTELQEKQEYERVAFPVTVPEMIAITKREKQERQEKILAREAQIAKNLEKLDQWKKDIEMRKEKKETVKRSVHIFCGNNDFFCHFQDARVAKERKDRLIEEVRRHFGYTIDPRDERFKEMLEMKEKEQRKVMKESKRQAKEKKLMTKLIEGNDPGAEKNEDEIEKK